MRGTLFFQDLKNALRLRELIVYRAYSEVRARYKRTMIGPFWTSLSMAIFILTFGMIGARLWKMDVGSFMPFFCAGYLSWMLISTIINESKTLFISNKGILESTAIPLHVFVLELILRNYIVFVHHLVVYAGVLLFFSYPLNANVLLMIPGFLIVFLASLGFSVIWGIACTRYRDLGQLSNNILQIIFFVTPIMWPAENLTGAGAYYLINLNPMYHFISITREPMLGHVPSLYSYGFAISTCILLFGMAVYMMERFRHRVVFWL